MNQPSASAHIGRDQFHLAWDRSIEPVVTVASGSIVEIDALDASGGQITAASTVTDLANLDFCRVDQVNGPIGVEGAEPGDSLEIELLEFQPADWGWTASIPGFGLLADDFPDAALRITRLEAHSAEFLPGVRIPLAPFCGEVGVAPPTEGAHSTIPPGRVRRQHGHPPPDRRHAASSSPSSLPAAASRWATGMPRRATERCAAPPSRRRCGCACG